MTKQPIPFSKFNPREAHSASQSLAKLTAPFGESNPFIGDYHAHLSQETQKLTIALNKITLSDLTASSKQMDIGFNRDFQDLRNILKAKASVKALRDEADASAELLKDIEDVGGAIEDLPKKEQIVAFELLMRKWGNEEKTHKLQVAHVKELYDEAAKRHFALIRLEDKKAALSSDLKEVLPAWEASACVKPVLSIIYGHIEDFAELEHREEYQKLLLDIQAELAPIVKNVRTRLNKSDNDSEE